MRLVNVVPIRRLPTDHPWFTYQVPDSLTVQVGSLVLVPFRHRLLAGIVWDDQVQSITGKLIHSVNRVLLPYPFVTPWQRRVFTVMAETGAVSMADVLARSLPPVSQRQLAAWPTGLLLPAPPQVEPPKKYWYRDRQQVLDWMIERIRANRSLPMVVVTPTILDAHELADLCRRYGLASQVVTSTMRTSAHQAVYRTTLTGRPLLVIGTLKALGLPFQHPPQIIFDQSEHSAHKQSAQHPRYDTAVIINQLSQPYSATTPAPLVRDFLSYQSPPQPTGRRLVSLDRPTAQAWLADETLMAIDQTLAGGQSILAIAPRRGYASSTRCRSCGYTLTCPTCQRRAAMFRGLSDSAECRACRTTIALPAACLRCGSTEWSIHGVGIERLTVIIKHQYPAAVVSSVASYSIPADVYVDSYLAYHQVRQLPRLGLIVILCGDALLNVPDYATAERAWQYLARLQAEFPAGPLMAQSLAPESTFWQRWMAGGDQAWYGQEIATRQRLKLPPAVVQWIARYRGSDEIMQQTRGRISQLKTGRPETVVLPQRSGRAASEHRLLLTFDVVETAKTFPVATVFPRPWQIDFYPRSWLD